jgi:cytochrome b561
MLMATSAQKLMMQFTITLLPLHGMLVSMWGENNYMRFLQTCFNSSRQQINIVLTKDDIHTLINVVIANPT